MSRRAFTLTELLVATIVFLVGFVSVFGLFLGGMRMRKLAEDTTRASLAASCLIDEIRIDAGGGGAIGGGAPMAPKAYVGDGFAVSAEPDGDVSGVSAVEQPLFGYKPVPGVWYRVMTCTDLEDQPTNSQTTVLKLDLLVVPFSTADSTLTFGDLDRRLSLLSEKTRAQRDAASAEEVSSRLVQRGLAFRFVAVVTRRPSWLP